MKNHSKRLLILSCSARKRADDKCRALDRYLSPSFFVLRRWLKNNPENDLTVLIFSAKYGLISADKLTEHYDLVLTPEREKIMRRKIAKQFEVLVLKNKFNYALIHLPKHYFNALEPHIELLKKKTNCSIANGAPGKKNRFMKNWLEKPNE